MWPMNRMELVLLPPLLQILVPQLSHSDFQSRVWWMIAFHSF